MSSKIYVNGKFTSQIVTGVQRYAWEITERLEERVQLLKPGQLYRGAAGHIWEQICLPYQVPKNSFLWSPTGAGPIMYSKQIVTIHDIAHIEHPEWYSSNFVRWYRWMLPRLLKNTAHILTVSSYSKQRIMEYFGVPDEKISIAPCGVDQRFFTANEEDVRDVKQKYKLPQNYVLCVSSISPRKNFERIFQAWSSIAYRFPDISLVIAGSAGLAFARNLDPNKIPKGVIFTGYANDKELPALYAGASAFIYTSLYEGFGIPILEAMAAGTPVVTSETTSMPEAGGEAAIYVDPYQTESIAEGIKQILENTTLQMKLRELGLQNASRFSWDQSAHLVWNVLQDFVR